LILFHDIGDWPEIGFLEKLRENIEDKSWDPDFEGVENPEL